MPSIIEIILNATDNTAGGFASARANLQGLQAASQQMARGTTGTPTAARQAVSATQAQRSATAIASAEIAAHARVQAAMQTGHNRIEAQRLSSIGRVEAADRAANARVTAAEIAADARVEAERIRAENRIEMLQRRNAASGGGGPALPRTFAGFTQAGLLQGAGALGIATGGAELVAQMSQLASAGQAAQVSLDGTRASLGALLQDQQRANDVFDRAVAVGREYGSTQQEVASALQASALLIRDTNQPIEKTMEVLMRLSSLNPAEGVEGASFAIAELASGDIVSLNERFRIGRDEARAWRDQIMAGADPIEVMNRGLLDMGIGVDAISARMAGAAGEQRRYNMAIEDMSMALNEAARASGLRDFLPQLLGDTAQQIRDITAALEAMPAAFQNMIPAPVLQAFQFLDRVEDRLSGQLQQSKNLIAAGLGSGGPGGSGFGRSPTASDAEVTPPPPLSRRTGPYANTLVRTPGGVTMTPQAQGAVINNYNITVPVQGSLVHTGDVVDNIETGMAQKAQRTGSTRRR